MREENEIKNVLKVEGNVFTKKKCNNIMRKKHTYSKVNYKLICEREGLFMKETKDVVLNEIEKSKELSLKDKIIIRLFPKTFVKVYGIAGKTVFNNMYIS